MPFKAPEAPKCPKCDRSVYAAEEKMAGGYKFHKVCFKCDMCNKLLDSTTVAEHNKELYCKACHGRKYGPKGVGFGAGAGALCMDSGEQFGNTEGVSNGNGHIKDKYDVIQAPDGQGCPRCGGYVYHADQVFSKDRVWHKGCFKCGICARFLDSRIACDGPDKDVYCNACYRKRFGLKGYGFGQASGPALMSGDVEESQDSMPNSAKYIDTASIMAGPGEHGCPRCGGQVFHAEQMFSKGNIYHKKCFTCNSCKRPLDSVLCCDGPDGEIYCKGCYAKTFGAKGYGFGGGAGFLMCPDNDALISERPTVPVNVASIQGIDGGKDTCPRCGGQVFHAERMLSKNNVFHKVCFTCLECKRPLDSTSCCDSPDGEIFCKLCYAKNYGPKGYGFGGTGSVPALMSGEQGQYAEERISVDFMPGKESRPVDGKGCPRCGFSVYEAEKMIAAQRSWHKRCFTCATETCNRHLDSTTVNDGPDGEIYCKSCYSAKFGIKGYGFGKGASTPALLSDGSLCRSQQDSEMNNVNKMRSETAFILP